MGILKRLFSAEYRAAVSAEAAGQLEQAAEHYVLAGEHAEAARIHLARADRAMSRADRVAALRDALHWAGSQPELARRIHRELGRVLMDQVRAEGVATQRDKERVREAARLLMLGGDHAAAGEAFESIDDIQSATAAYSQGGLVDRMELVLFKDDLQARQDRTLRDGFANYEMHLRMGERDAARDDLRSCIQSADNKAGYRRLLDELESRLITGGVVVLRHRQGPVITALCIPSLALGRDNLCELPLRAGSVSRRHAEISVGPADADPRFHVRDAGSRKGTSIAGLPIAGSVPLAGEGTFALAEDCAIAYLVRGQPAHLILRVQSGPDRGRALIAGGPDERLDLGPILGLPVCVEFREGRPFLDRTDRSATLKLGTELIAEGAVQLIHGDELVIDASEVDVL